MSVGWVGCGLREVRVGSPQAAGWNGRLAGSQYSKECIDGTTRAPTPPRVLFGGRASNVERRTSEDLTRANGYLFFFFLGQSGVCLRAERQGGTTRGRMAGDVEYGGQQVTKDPRAGVRGAGGKRGKGSGWWKGVRVVGASCGARYQYSVPTNTTAGKSRPHMPYGRSYSGGAPLPASAIIQLRIHATKQQFQKRPARHSSY